MLLSLMTVASLSARPLTLPASPSLLAQARAELEQDLAAYSWNPRTHVLLGRVDAKAGRWPEAMAQFQIAARDGDLEALMDEARQHLRWAEWSSALGESQRALAQASAAKQPEQELDARLVRDYAWVRLGRYRRAIRDGKSILDDLRDVSSAAESGDSARGTELARAYTVMGCAMSREVQREGFWALLLNGHRVTGDFDRALHADPLAATAWYGLGRYYLRAPWFFHDSSRAMRDLTQAVELAPGNLEIRAWYLYALDAGSGSRPDPARIAKFKADFIGVSTASPILAEILAGGTPD